MVSTKECKLAFPQLPETSREGYILSGLTHSSKISIGNICDAECKSVFTYANVQIIKYGQIILTVTREKKTRLC